MSADVLYIEPLPAPAPQPRDVAGLILAGFERHYALFRYSAQRAKSLFESGDWHGMQRLSRERIEYYDMRVRECASHIEGVMRRGGAAAGAAPLDEAQTVFWQAVRQEYVALLAGHRQPECAETFFNSVSCRVLHRDYFHNDFLFVRPAVATDHLDSRLPAYRAYYPLAEGLRASLARMVADFGLAAPYADLPRDIRLLARKGVAHLRAALSRLGGPRLAADCQLHALGSLFFRQTGAYIVGRLVNQGAVHPFAVALRRDPAGQVTLDALLLGADDLSRLFSFTRAYFLVDMETPAAVVDFLGSLLPAKPKAELYSMLGLQKQGKTLFYRDFLRHLEHSHDRFTRAPGIPGMVMAVFTLPSYPYVFKLIKDEIEKDGMDRATVQRKYQMVKRHDRVGRMADSWEYTLVALPRARFEPALLDELRRVAPSQLEEDGDTVVIRHVYIERRMMPLNLYLRRASAAQRAHAMREYGNAIRELAAANIFPGDMLYKNFGVTRLGRVVFYDYDEIQPLTAMHFRRIPPAPNEEAELAGEPWYAVGPDDVFPEEFARFLLADPAMRADFLRHHAPLLEPQWWQACQARVAQGKVEDFFPYDTDRRLRAGPARLRRAGTTAPYLS
ncbi:bifunctional isocitrate dehydrogenase kinase/phosphatase [Bordetella sp. 2513F-2]